MSLHKFCVFLALKKIYGFTLLLQKNTWYVSFSRMEDIQFTYILYGFLILITWVKNFKFE